MENENDPALEENQTEQTEETTENAEIDWKQVAEKYKGLAARNYSKLQKLEEKLKANETSVINAPEIMDKKTDGLDYGQLAYLKAYGVSGEEELKLVKDYISSGKKIEDIVENKHFKNDLSDVREAMAVKEATPTTSKRSAPSQKDNVDYWINKGELPPVEQLELRRTVLNEKIKREQTKDRFTDTPVIGA